MNKLISAIIIYFSGLAINSIVKMKDLTEFISDQTGLFTSEGYFNVIFLVNNSWLKLFDPEIFLFRSCLQKRISIPYSSKPYILPHPNY